MNREGRWKIALVIIGLAILTGFLILKKPTNLNTLNKENLNNQNNIKQENAIARVFNLEKINKKLSADIQGLEIPDTQNLTEKVATELSQKIILLNANNDLSSGELEVPNEELFSEEMIEKYKGYFLRNLPIVTAQQLTFGPENPPHTSFKYFVDIMQIIYNRKITEDIIQLSLESAITEENVNSDFLKDVISKLNEAVIDFKKLPIPPSFTDLHLEITNLMIARKAVLTALCNYQKDPISALAASQLLEELDNHYKLWLSEIVKKMQADGINFKF